MLQRERCRSLGRNQVFVEVNTNLFWGQEVGEFAVGRAPLPVRKVVSTAAGHLVPALFDRVGVVFMQHDGLRYIC